MPVFNVGPGCGWKNGECREGRGLPVRIASALISGETTPSQNWQMGIFSAVRPNSLKSSPPITGWSASTRSAPSQLEAVRDSLRW